MTKKNQAPVGADINTVAGELYDVTKRLEGLEEGPERIALEDRQAELRLAINKGLLGQSAPAKRNPEAERMALILRIEALERSAARREPAGVENALGFLDLVERDLGAALEYAGGGHNMSGEDWEGLLMALAAAWKNARYTRRELDHSAWEKYRPTGEARGSASSDDDDIDTSDNDGEEAAQ